VLVLAACCHMRTTGVQAQQTAGFARVSSAALCAGCYCCRGCLIYPASRSQPQCALWSCGCTQQGRDLSVTTHTHITAVWSVCDVCALCSPAAAAVQSCWPEPAEACALFGCGCTQWVGICQLPHTPIITCTCECALCSPAAAAAQLQCCCSAHAQCGR
jgi:hypothetical protein